ncbi:MAG: hypothetical protein AAFV29_24955, partial [Myxococcota bacterium]
APYLTGRPDAVGHQSAFERPSMIIGMPNPSRLLVVRYSARMSETGLPPPERDQFVTYVTMKTVRAKRMPNEALAWCGRLTDADKDDTTPGYAVEYSDGYRSWCPRDQFVKSAFLPMRERGLDEDIGS